MVSGIFNRQVESGVDRSDQFGRLKNLIDEVNQSIKRRFHGESDLPQIVLTDHRPCQAISNAKSIIADGQLKNGSDKLFYRVNFVYQSCDIAEPKLFQTGQWRSGSWRAGIDHLARALIEELGRRYPDARTATASHHIQTEIAKFV